MYETLHYVVSYTAWVNNQAHICVKMVHFVINESLLKCY